MRFEKVSFEAFRKDMLKCKFTEETILTAYERIQLPERATKYSAGYDFVTPVDFVLRPGERMVIPTGIKAVFNDDIEKEIFHLELYIRSSLGIKKDVTLSNSVAIVDSDYANNPNNDGDILMALHNTGYNYIHFETGDRIMQGVFKTHATVENDNASGERTGGVGSTDKENTDE